MRWLGRALIDSLLAGLATGAIELARVLSTSTAEWGAASAAGLVWLVLGLVVLGAALAGPPIAALAAGIARARPVATWLDELRAGGGARAGAVARAAIFLAAVGAMGGVTFAVASWTHRAFVEPRAIAVLEAAILPAAGLLLLVVGGAATRRLGARAAASARLGRAVSGGR
ncbi:MAG TPA: hypothetical protein VMZ28_06265, partial [Kofleriaceae bacterium]|nr:hypothetical protein [Kofleriaceae bacterium]